MKTQEELKLFFERSITPHMAPLEAKRRKAKRKILFYHFLFGLLELALIGFPLKFILEHSDAPYQKGDAIGYFALGITYLTFLSAIVVAWRERIRRVVTFRDEFKKTVMEPLVRFLWPELSYTPDKMIVPGALFLGSEIFPHAYYYPRGYWAEDFVSGRIGETVFEFFEIDGGDFYLSGDVRYTEHLYPGVIPVAEIPPQPPEEISFQGLFFVADFHKSFKGSTLIRTEDRGVRSRWVRATGRELVRLEDPEFEKHFAVYSTDQITARYILSPGLMKRISDYRSRTKRDIRISFRYNRIFIAMDLGKNAFEVNVNRSLYDFENVLEYYRDLQLTLDIVEDLNLNTRIWQKEVPADDKMIPEIPRYSFKNVSDYRFLGFLGIFLYVPGAHNLYLGYYKKGIAQLMIAYGSLTLGIRHSANPNLHPNIQPWVSFVLLAVYAWIIVELFSARTDSHGDLLSRASPFKAHCSWLWRLIRLPLTKETK